MENYTFIGGPLDGERATPGFKGPKTLILEPDGVTRLDKPRRTRFIGRDIYLLIGDTYRWIPENGIQVIRDESNGIESVDGRTLRIGETTGDMWFSFPNGDTVFDFSQPKRPKSFYVGSQTMSFVIRPELRKKLEARADWENVNVSTVIRSALEGYLGI